MRPLAAMAALLIVGGCVAQNRGPWMAEQPIPPQFAEPARYWPPGSSEAELIATLEAAGYHIDRRAHQADRMIGTRPHCVVTHVIQWTMQDEHRVETVTSSRSDICRG